MLPKFISWEGGAVEIHHKRMAVCVCMCVLVWGLENIFLCSAEMCELWYHYLHMMQYQA